MCRASKAVPQPASTEPTFGPTWPNFARVGGDGEIAQRRENIAAANGEAVDARDHGLGNVAYDRLEFVDRQANNAAPIILTFVRALIAAGAERLVACAGQNDAGYALVVRGPI